MVVYSLGIYIYETIDFQHVSICHLVARKNLRFASFLFCGNFSCLLKISVRKQSALFAELIEQQKQVQLKKNSMTSPQSDSNSNSTRFAICSSHSKYKKI